MRIFRKCALNGFYLEKSYHIALGMYILENVSKLVFFR